MKSNEKVFSNTVINWYPGHMAKAKRLIKERLELIDIVYELVDGALGDHYPYPPRCLKYTEQVLQQYLQKKWLIKLVVLKILTVA